MAEVSAEKGICTAILVNWRNGARAQGQSMPDSDKPVKIWSSEEKFTLVMQSAAMNQLELAEYCRKHCIYLKQLEQWREACKSANEPPSRAQRRREQSESRVDQKKIKQLEAELSRNESALAETAALLVLRKKANAI